MRTVEILIDVKEKGFEKGKHFQLLQFVHNGSVGNPMTGAVVKAEDGTIHTFRIEAVKFVNHKNQED